MHDSFKALLPLLIPEGVSDYFEMNHYSKEEQRLDIFLEEMNIIPQEYKANKLISKGFFEAITLQDFPIRGLQVYLHVKRRSWLNQDTDKVVFKNWELVATAATYKFFGGGYLKVNHFFGLFVQKCTYYKQLIAERYLPDFNAEMAPIWFSELGILVQFILCKYSCIWGMTTNSGYKNPKEPVILNFKGTIVII